MTLLCSRINETTYYCSESLTVVDEKFNLWTTWMIVGIVFVTLLISLIAVICFYVLYVKKRNSRSNQNVVRVCSMVPTSNTTTTTDPVVGTKDAQSCYDSDLFKYSRTRVSMV